MKLSKADVLRLDPDGSEAFHWRVSYRRETHEIYFVSINLEHGEPEAFTISGVEPLLGPVDLRNWMCVCQPCTFPGPNQNRCGSGIQWVICGGESGPGARPMPPDWARNLRDQCEAAGVPFFFKQWGEWSPNDLCSPEDELMHKVGKKAAGAVLDGREWREMPR